MNKIIINGLDSDSSSSFRVISSIKAISSALTAVRKRQSLWLLSYYYSSGKKIILSVSNFVSCKQVVQLPSCKIFHCRSDKSAIQIQPDWKGSFGYGSWNPEVTSICLWKQLHYGDRYYKQDTGLTIFLHLQNFWIVIQIVSASLKFGNELLCPWLWRTLMTLERCVLLYFWMQEVTVRIYVCLTIKFTV